MKDLDPKQAFGFLKQHRHAAFIDCRSESEYFLVGHAIVPASADESNSDFSLETAWRAENICYSDDMNYTANDDFVPQCIRFIGPDLHRPVVIICRSGRRSGLAGHDLEAVGYTNVFNVVFGFEGETNERDQRGKLNGWRFDGLPWEQL